MATLCKLCDKKISFFAGSYSIAGQTICENCYQAYAKVLDSVSNIEDFKKDLAEFQNAFKGTESIEKIAIYLED